MDLGTRCDRCGDLWFPLDRSWLHRCETHICGSCVTPLDERVVLLATAAATFRSLGGPLDDELYALSDWIGEEHARQLDRNRELRELLEE
jgi:hypothetical protein